MEAQGNSQMPKNAHHMAITLALLLIAFVVLLIGIVRLFAYNLRPNGANVYNALNQIPANNLNITSANVSNTSSILFNYTNNNISAGAEFSENSTIEYMLQMINGERLQYGLQSVTLSNEPSAQFHANSMLNNDYFSHWDPYGMKPYMRYTILGGNQSVDENVAYKAYLYEECLGKNCNIEQVNVTYALSQMENSMLYNDSLCCNNGHRKNILDPNHNEVSIGIAYNKTNVYLVEDFIDNYINWIGGGPNISNQNVTLQGYMLHGARISDIGITYDPAPLNMTRAELDNTSSYGYGQQIAGVTYGNYYYPVIATIYASTYHIEKNYFDIAFNMSTLEHKYGAGAYTLMIYMNNSTDGTFLGGTHTIFINNSLEPYIPSRA